MVTSSVELSHDAMVTEDAPMPAGAGMAEDGGALPRCCCLRSHAATGGEKAASCACCGLSGPVTSDTTEPSTMTISQPMDAIHRYEIR